MNQHEIRFEGEKVIEFGGGNRNIFVENVDVVPGPTVTCVHDFEQFPYPFENESYDGIYAAYAIEHIPWRKAKHFFSECYRILKPHGKAIFLAPNLSEQCKKIVAEGVNEGTVEMLFGSQEFPNHAGAHKCGFSPEYAVKMFKEAGFTTVNVYVLPDIQFPHIILKIASATDLLIEVIK